MRSQGKSARRISVLIVLTAMSANSLLTRVSADEVSSTVESMPPVAAPSPTVNSEKKTTSSGPLLVRPGAKKGKRREQKETEGTEAPGRFEADTILKSHYHVDGQPLEVDPD